MELQQNVPLAPRTTFAIGGPARWFAEATSESEILEAVTWARQRSLPIFILGGGSNLLISDSGFDGLVLHIATRGVTITPEGDTTLFSAAAGENWDEFVSLAIAHNCAGVECLAGIPGTVGGTPVQNVGAYGQEVSETISQVRVLHLESLEFHTLPATECGFAYRTSIFNTSARNRYLVTQVDFRLRPGAPPNLRYADLQRAFADKPTPTLAQTAAEVRAIRRAKGMLIVPGDPDCQSAGSFFKNPILAQSQFADLTVQLGSRPPHYPAGPGHVKLPAAWLVEKAGFARGYALGHAAISSRHTLALTNQGGATASEILALRDQITVAVQTRFGIVLTMEPVLVGFS